MSETHPIKPVIDPAQFASPSQLDTTTPEFLQEKTAYFTALAGQLKGALAFHKEQGLWDRVDGQRDWGNVTEHCLVEAARVQMFADVLGFDDELTSDLTTAAALHDYFKKGEKEILEQKGLSWEAYDEAQDRGAQILEDGGVKPRVVWLVSSPGHSSLNDVGAVLAKEELTEDEIAYLVMHYVDDYTVNSDWANGTRIDGSIKVNDLDTRMDKNEANQRYKVIDEAGREHFNGETAFAAQRRVGHAVEQRLAGIIQERTGTQFDPIDLPVLIDNQVKSTIAPVTTDLAA